MSTVPFVPAVPVGARERRLGISAIMTATLFWSFGSVLGKMAGSSGVVTSFWRLWIATAVAGVLALATNQLPDRATLRAVAPAGVLFGINLCMFFTAIETLSIATALIILALTPVVMLPIAVAVLGERLTVWKAICSATAIGAVMIAVLVAPEGEGGLAGSTMGYVWLVGTLVTWVVFLVLTKRVRSEVDTLPLMLSVSGTAAVIVSVLVVVGGHDVSAVEGQSWMWIALLAIGPGLSGHSLLTWAQPRVDASVSTVLIQAEPLGGTLAAYVLLDEPLGTAQLAAMGIALGALAVLAYRESIERAGPLDVDCSP